MELIFLQEQDIKELSTDSTIVPRAADIGVHWDCYPEPWLKGVPDGAFLGQCILAKALGSIFSVTLEKFILYS